MPWYFEPCHDGYLVTSPSCSPSVTCRENDKPDPTHRHSAHCGGGIPTLISGENEAGYRRKAHAEHSGQIRAVLREARHMYFKEKTLAIWLCKQNVMYTFSNQPNEVLAADYLSWNGYADNEL